MENMRCKPLPGIWHTGLVAYGREYYFGSTGIESCRPGETILGEPDQILTLGKTELPYSVFLEYIFALGESTYRPGSYHLLEHNCNCFSQEVCQFLTGGPIPAEIRELPHEISASKNLSSALKEYFNKLSLRAEGSRGISFGAQKERVADEHRNGHASSAQPRPQQNGTRRKKSSSGLSDKQPKQPKEQPQQVQEEAPAPLQEAPPLQPSAMSNGSAPQEPEAILQEANNGAVEELNNGAGRVLLNDDEDEGARLPTRLGRPGDTTTPQCCFQTLTVQPY
ncbi:desumoylating isopeptidase 1 [Caerostris darwini]|uniref:Desumoylating isopeptidase 1 n=1 Tax=Caerostris darwini TaxID=1538125 RepID=A0AAV4TWX9_9ARAC|nr:desumoylating isopeptidase 1 [Caerostris darwini]